MKNPEPPAKFNPLASFIFCMMWALTIAFFGAILTEEIPKFIQSVATFFAEADQKRLSLFLIWFRWTFGFFSFVFILGCVRNYFFPKPPQAPTNCPPP